MSQVCAEMLGLVPGPQTAQKPNIAPIRVCSPGSGVPQRPYHLPTPSGVRQAPVASKRGVQVADLSAWTGGHVLFGWENSR
jgi:hypothetical protein